MENGKLLDPEIHSLLLDKHFFHDYNVQKIYFSLLGNKFRLILSTDIDNTFSIVIKNIFSFSYIIDFLVDEENYNILSWNRIFKFLRHRNLLDIDIDKSGYNDLSLKYLNKKALKIIMKFDCGFKLEFDCIDLEIEKICRESIRKSNA